jgi:hypothetical protein
LEVLVAALPAVAWSAVVVDSTVAEHAGELFFEVCREVACSVAFAGHAGKVVAHFGSLVQARQSMQTPRWLRPPLRGRVMPQRRQT